MRHILCGLVFLAALVGGSAQPSVEIFWDESNRADTVMDFGVTLEGAPVTITFTVVNNDNVDVGILNTFGTTAPYYQIINTSAVPPESPRKEEFEAADPLPYVIAPGERQSFGVTFRALPNSPNFPVDVVTEALLELRVIKMIDSLGPSRNERFLLRALKTRNILASTTPWIRFDSVYVNPTPLTPELPYRVDNVTNQRVPVDRQLLEIQTSVTGQPEIEVDTFPSAEFGPRGSLTWTSKYRPHDRGRDSALYHVVYRPNRNAELQDTITASISGFGVEQRYIAINASGDRQAVELRGDTIDFGGVDADGTGGVVALILFRNDGNVNVHVNAETESGTPRAIDAYKVERSLMSNGAFCATNDFDTLVVRFDPTDGGLHEMQYDIVTDLKQRNIRGVPDGAQTTTLYFRGFAQRPQLQVSPPTIDFGQVVLLSSCASASERQIVIRNAGNVTLRVDSIVVQPSGTPITVIPSNFTVALAGQQIVTLRYEPQVIETLNASVVLHTNAFGVPYAMQASGSSIDPDTISATIPRNMRVRPGTILSVPVLVDANRVTLAETSSMVISFDPSLMRYRGSRTGGTASEGATILRQDESPRGVLTVALDANGAFLERDTMIVLLFDTYLGDRPVTEIALSTTTTTFGNAGCASVLDVTVNNGSYQIDSICGLSYKTAAVQGFIVSAAVFPNPTSESCELTLATGEAQDITYTFIDELGRPLTTSVSLAIPAGITLVPVDVPMVRSGTYFIDISTPYQRVVVPLQVTR